MPEQNWNRLFLIRHGENRANLTNEFSYKKVDYPLTSRGKLQAFQTAPYFRSKKIVRIFSSPLKRAHQTATIIGDVLNCEITILENFREVNVGDLENYPSLDNAWMLHNQIFDDWFSGKYETCFPRGEDYFSLVNRVKDGIAQIITDQTRKNFIIVGHAGIFTALAKNICNKSDFESIKKQEVQNCSITILDALVDDECNLRTNLENWASTTHLD